MEARLNYHVGAKITAIADGSFSHAKLKSIIVPLGPYDNSDYIEIEELDNGEIAVIHGNTDRRECVLSAFPEEV